MEQEHGIFPYGVAPPESWSTEEQRSLEETLREFPMEKSSFLNQCTKIAERLPKKSIRDVAIRIRYHMPCIQGEEQGLWQRVEQLSETNIQIIKTIRENLHNINLADNIPLMREFDRNIAESFALLGRLDTKLPPFPVRVNTMYLSGNTNFIEPTSTGPPSQTT
mmetsp:Transcript_6518/g.7722  ORF Transcript_6518/g.7722 Transcript_6518/m.7722 type:complete len:164 (-) Transcript_6518:258-749(-)